MGNAPTTFSHLKLAILSEAPTSPTQPLAEE